LIFLKEKYSYHFINNKIPNTIWMQWKTWEQSWNHDVLASVWATWLIKLFTKLTMELIKQEKNFLKISYKFLYYVWLRRNKEKRNKIINTFFIQVKRKWSKEIKEVRFKKKNLKFYFLYFLLNLNFIFFLPMIFFFIHEIN